MLQKYSDIISHQVLYQPRD